MHVRVFSSLHSFQTCHMITFANDFVCSDYYQILGHLQVKVGLKLSKLPFSPKQLCYIQKEHRMKIFQNI